MRKILTSVLAGALIFGAVTASSAYSLNPFASYLFQESNKPYKFTNAGVGSTFGLTSANGVPVTFKFSTGSAVAADLIANGYGSLVGVDIPATLVSMSADAPVGGTSNGFVEQGVVNVAFKIVDSSNRVLLSGTSDFGLLSGKKNGSNGSLEATDDVPIDNVSFASDFVNLGSPKYAAQAYSITTTSQDPKFGLDDNGWLKTSTGAYNGNFSIAEVPEPGALAMLIGFGVSGSLFIIRRRRA